MVIISQIFFFHKKQKNMVIIVKVFLNGGFICFDDLFPKACFGMFLDDYQRFSYLKAYIIFAKIVNVISAL